MRKPWLHPVGGLLLAFACAPIAALAHAGHGDIAGLGDGILHVTSGVDHILAAVAIGIWSMHYPWRRAWMLPAAFVTAMCAAAAVGIGRAGFDAADLMIVATLIVLGMLIMRAQAFSIVGAVAICAVFGALHGYAHGTEAGSSGDHLAYLGGLVVATALLHVAGMALGLMLRLSSRYGMRVAGAAVAAAGVWLAVGLAA